MIPSSHLSPPHYQKHRQAGQIIAHEFERAREEVHLEIKKRGTVTTWAARHAHTKFHGA